MWTDISVRRGFYIRNILPSKPISTNRAARNLRSSALDEDVEAEVDYSQLTAKKRSIIEKFVQRMDGKRTIQRILIANNGMAATKAILSIRQWAYMMFGDERAIEFVAMATRDDLNANAEFIRLADTFVEVPSGSNKVILHYFMNVLGNLNKFNKFYFRIIMQTLI